MLYCIGNAKLHLAAHQMLVRLRHSHMSPPRPCPALCHNRLAFHTALLVAQLLATLGCIGNAATADLTLPPFLCTLRCSMLTVALPQSGDKRQHADTYRTQAFSNPSARIASGTMQLLH